jgi:hypothetical protein
MSNHKAGKDARQRDAKSHRQLPGAAGGGRVATHHIPQEDRHPTASSSLDPTSRDYVPVNETPPPHVLDPEGHAKRLEQDQKETREAAAKRNASIAADEGKDYAPRPARTSRDRAIQSGGKIPYDNSQAGAFRDSSQKNGEMPEERYKGGDTHPPATPDGRTSQQADTPPGGTLPSGNASAPEAVETKGGEVKRKKHKS